MDKIPGRPKGQNPQNESQYFCGLIVRRWWRPRNVSMENCCNCGICRAEPRDYTKVVAEFGPGEKHIALENGRKCSILSGFLVHIHSDMNREVIVQYNSQRKEPASVGGQPGCFPSSVILG